MEERFLDACKYGNAFEVGRLVSLGADVHASGYAGFHAACEKGYIAVVDVLLHAGVDLDKEKGLGLTAAARNGHLSVVQRILEEPLVRPSDVAKALVTASENGRLGVVDFLVGRGADALYQDNRAFWSAIENGHVAVVRRLVESDANLLERWGDLLPCAVSADTGVKMIQYFLDEGVDPLTDNAEQALCIASRHGREDVVEALLKAGVRVCGHWADLAIASASKNGNVSVVRLLLLAGADATKIVWPRYNRKLCVSWSQANHHESLMPYVRKEHVAALPQKLQRLWVKINVRPRVRLGACLRRARDRLDRPPTGALGKARPTRTELIEHLQTAGRRFAREYWTEGAPLFFAAEVVAALGPVPIEFEEVTGAPSVQRVRARSGVGAAFARARR